MTLSSSLILRDESFESLEKSDFLADDEEMGPSFLTTRGAFLREIVFLISVTWSLISPRSERRSENSSDENELDEPLDFDLLQSHELECLERDERELHELEWPEWQSSDDEDDPESILSSLNEEATPPQIRRPMITKTTMMTIAHKTQEYEVQEDSQGLPILIPNKK
jgi:hypothetical protein